MLQASYLEGCSGDRALFTFGHLGLGDVPAVARLLARYIALLGAALVQLLPMDSFLSAGCAGVQAAPPAGHSWGSQSSRVAAVSHAAAIGVHTEFMGNWAPGSITLRRT